MAAPYGMEMILDLHECDSLLFHRSAIKNFFVELCDLIGMEREDLNWWDYEGDPEGYEEAPSHLKGVSAVQFIKTSNITIHTLTDLRRVYLNIFSCKPFDAKEAKDFCTRFFHGHVANCLFVTRV